MNAGHISAIHAACEEIGRDLSVSRVDRACYLVLCNFEDGAAWKSNWNLLDTAARDLLSVKARKDPALYDAMKACGVDFLFDRPAIGDEVPSFSDDDLGFIQLAASSVLSAVARGELDLNALARRALASRGQDERGLWVGFDRAREIHGVK